MKKLLLVFHHLRLPDESGGLRSYFILKRFLEFQSSNLSITVLLPSVDTLTGKYSRIYLSRNVDIFPSNVTLRFIRCMPFDKSNSFSRFLSYFQYSIKCFFAVSFSGNFTAYLVTTYSLPVLLAVRLKSWLYQSQMWIEVRDLFAQALQCSAVKNGSHLIRLLAYIYIIIEKTILKSSDLVIPNSRGFSPTIFSEYNLSESRTMFVPLGIDDFPLAYRIQSDEDFYFSQDSELSSLKKCLSKINQKYEFSFVYCGSLDIVHSSILLTDFLEKIQRLDLNLCIHLFGASSEHLCLSDKYSFVFNHGLVSKRLLSQLLPVFHSALYFSSDRYPFNSILGNKVFDYISAGLPIVFLSESYALRFAEEHSLGFFLDVESISFDFVEQMLVWQNRSRESFDKARLKFNSTTLTRNMVNSLFNRIS